MGIIDAISQKVIDGDVETIEHEINILRVAVLHMFCLEILYETEACSKKMGVVTIFGKEFNIHGEVEAFQIKNGFSLE